jgi:hypothetical protein
LEQIDVLIKAYHNVQVRNEFGTSGIKEAIDEHAWQLTKSYMMGLEVNDAENRAMKIEDEKSRVLSFVPFKICPNLYFNLEESCAVAPTTCDVIRLSSSSVLEPKYINKRRLFLINEYNFLFRFWFYQTDRDVIVEIPIEGLKQEQIQVEATYTKVNIFYKYCVNL